MRSPAAGPAPAADTSSAESAALADAIAALLRPLARLAVARGVPFAAVEDQLKRAFVDAGREAHPRPPLHRAVSRIATATGLNRRDVTRLTQQAASPARTRPPLAAEVFARWSGDRAYRTRRGQPRVLPRLGEAPSFEALAQSVTRDVHPRSLLDELTRLGLARFDERRDTVVLQRDAYVPHGDAQRMLGFLASNVGDHLDAAVANVLGGGNAHFEQAVFADELSTHSLDAMRDLVSAQWRSIATTLVPEIQALIDDDRAAGRPCDRRLRIGLYTYAGRNGEEAAPSAPSAADSTKGTDGSAAPSWGGPP